MESDSGTGLTNLESFAEHVLPLFHTQQINDDLFAVEPPQSREVPAQVTLHK